MLDRSPDELGSGDEDMGDSDSDMDDANETTHDGERVIYPWMKKIHVAGVGEQLRSDQTIFQPLILAQARVVCCCLDGHGGRHIPKSNQTFFAQFQQIHVKSVRGE